MTRHITTSLVALAALIGAGSLAACNTMRGAGQDIEAGGQAVQESATEVQQDMNDGK